MIHLLAAIVVGILVAVGATFVTGSVLLGVDNGKPVNAQLYNYGTR
jgi:hypothetical protein